MPGAPMSRVTSAQRNAEFRWREIWGDLATHVGNARVRGFSEREIRDELDGILRKDLTGRLLRGAPAPPYALVKKAEVAPAELGP